MAYPLEPARVRWSIGKVGNGRSDPMPRAALHPSQHLERGTAPLSAPKKDRGSAERYCPSARGNLSAKVCAGALEY